MLAFRPNIIGRNSEHQKQKTKEIMKMSMYRKDFETMVSKMVRTGNDGRNIRYDVREDCCGTATYICNGYIGIKETNIYGAPEIEDIIRNAGGIPIRHETLCEILETSFCDRDGYTAFYVRDIGFRWNRVTGGKKWTAAILAGCDREDIIDIKMVNAKLLDIVNNDGRCDMYAKLGKDSPVTVIGKCYAVVMPVCYDERDAGFIHYIGETMINPPEMAILTAHNSK